MNQDLMYHVPTILLYIGIMVGLMISVDRAESPGVEDPDEG